jgi:hypothetical protein
MTAELMTAFALFAIPAAGYSLLRGRKQARDKVQLRAFDLAPARTIGEARDGEVMTVRGRIVLANESKPLVYRAFESNQDEQPTALAEVLVAEFRLDDGTGEILVRTPGATFFVVARGGVAMGPRELLLAAGDDVAVCGVAAWEAAAGESYREPSRRLVMSRDNGHPLRITNHRRALR